MELKFNAKGKDRKKLAETIGSFLNEKVSYTGVPKCSYLIKKIEVDKNGSVIIPDNFEDTEKLKEHLVSNGFTETNEVVNSKVAKPKTPREPKEPKQISETNMRIDGYIISLPRKDITDEELIRVSQIVDSKFSIIKKMFNTESYAMTEEDGMIQFHCLNGDATPELIQAAMVFFTKLVVMAKKQHTISAKEKPVDNEKYYARCFLLRLGLIGNEYKQARAVLLQNLSGNSAWREDKKNESVSE